MMSYFKAVIKEKADFCRLPAAEVSNCSSLLPSLDTSKNWKFGTMKMELQFLSNFYTLGYSLKDMQYYIVFSTLINLKHWISLSPPQKTHLPWSGHLKLISGHLKLIMTSYRKVSNVCVQWAVEDEKSMNNPNLKSSPLVLIYCSQHFSIKRHILEKEKKKEEPPKNKELL